MSPFCKVEMSPFWLRAERGNCGRGPFGDEREERERAHVIPQVSERRMQRARAAKLLGIAVRQVKRLVSAYRRFGDRGPVSRRRGKPSNNRLAAETVARMQRVAHFRDWRWRSPRM
jgi:Homeodomain-like domain